MNRLTSNRSIRCTGARKFAAAWLLTLLSACSTSPVAPPAALPAARPAASTAVPPATPPTRAAASAPLPAFALMGDMPYGAREIEPMRAIIAETGNDPDIAFIAFDGDLKSGGERCDDERILARRADFEASRHPFIYIPGDNEWTDCHRSNNGSYHPEERLARLREWFFPTDDSLGQRKMKLTRQGAVQPQFAAWRENVRWEFANTLMIGINIPGSNNNWLEQGSNHEFNARLQANTAWIETSFRTAREKNLAAVMLIMQANPDFEGTEAAGAKGRAGWRDGFAEFKAQLVKEAKAFGKPVVLVHGDTHSYQLNQPVKDATGALVANITRLETPGSPFLGWVRATVDANDPKVFKFSLRRYGGVDPLKPQ